MLRTIRYLLILLLFPCLISAQIAAGFVAKYPLNNAANDISGNNNNGTLTSVTGATDRFGMTNNAVQFSSGSSYIQIPVVVTDNFSVGFWFKSTMTGSSGSQWYSGSSLVDAEVCGVTNDWGLTLINGGHIAYGTGNPDVTIISPLAYNDGNWHFITATRDKTSTGTMTLYVDGVQVISTTGSINTGTLNSPTFIGFARNNCTGPNYTGTLDDIIFYNRVLSSTEVTNLYNSLNASPLPLNWLSFTGKADDENRIILAWEVGNPVGNDHFEIEHATDGEQFSLIGITPQQDAVSSTGGNLFYNFTDANAATGKNYYRIKQVDLDGKFTLSTIIQVTVKNIFTGISLLFNPVHDNLIVSNPGLHTINSLTIIDPAGRILTRLSPRSRDTSIPISVSSLSPGFYFLRTEGSGGVVTLRFIKK